MDDPFSLVVIGTRGSTLAVWQAEHVAARLQDALPGVRVRLERIRTAGDKVLDVPLAQIGGKALFVSEIEEALLGRRVDLAVHSMKDVPADVPAGLTIAAVPRREDPADVLISRGNVRFTDLPRGARVGTSSLRRQTQLLHRRPDLAIVALRGNLDTRIRKLDSEGLDAIVVAAAGVKRLGLADRIVERFPPEILLPAIGQGALAIEIRKPDGSDMSTSGAAARENDQRVAGMVNALDHRESHATVRAERAFLRRLGGGCQVPIAGLAVMQEGAIALSGLIGSTDGAVVVRGDAHGSAEDPEAIGHTLAEDLLARGGQDILASIVGGAARA